MTGSFTEVVGEFGAVWKNFGEGGTLGRTDVLELYKA